MADNTILNTGTGGDTISTDDLGGGVKVQRVKVQYGPDGSATDVDNAGNSLPVVAGGRTTIISTNFTRPADTTAYATGDLVANSTTAGSVTPLSFTNAARVAGGSGMIRRARVRKNGTSVTNSVFRLHLWNAIVTSSQGDNAAFTPNLVASYMGAFDITVDIAFADGASGNGLPRIGSEINFKLPSGSTIYGLIEARAAYTPASAEVFTVELEILQD